MRVVFKNGVIGWDLSGERNGCARMHAWYPIGGGIASKTAGGTRLPRHFVRVPLSAEKHAKSGETGMTGRIEPYCVSAYNTSKQSENKIHDDAVARRFGFSGGLVPGVDVMAYMIHLPVAKWGRAFLDHGLIEARFVKPVYDGEMADVTGEESDGVLAIEVRSRGKQCATGSASLPSSAPAVSISDFTETAAVTERRPVDTASYELGKWLGTLPRNWAGDAAQEYLTDVRETDPIYLSEGLGHPGLLQRVMNKVLVDNAILGPWIHVGSRMQLLSAARSGDELTARAKVTGNYEKKGHRFVELDALVVANGRTPLAHCQHIAIYQPRERAAA
jgi:acyl dehydratase